MKKIFHDPVGAGIKQYLISLVMRVKTAPGGVFTTRLPPALIQVMAGTRTARGRPKVLNILAQNPRGNQKAMGQKHQAAIGTQQLFQ